MASREFIATIENGKIPRDVAEDIAAIFRRMEGKRLVISIKEWKRRRSLKQNNFYFGVVIPLVCDLFRESGNDAHPETIHAYLKEHVGGMVSVILDPHGKRTSVVGSSADLSTEGWEKYIEKIRAWAAGFGWIIPLPREYLDGCTNKRIVIKREGDYAEDS